VPRLGREGTASGGRQPRQARHFGALRVADPLHAARWWLGSSTSGAKGDVVTAHDLMTPNPATVSPQTSIAAAWDVMRELDVRHVPVVQGGALVGMLSERDLARVDVLRLPAIEGAEAVRRELGTPVIEVMSSDVVCVEPETELTEIVGLLLEHKIGAIPVVRSDTRGVAGIVSYIDVLRAFRDLLEGE
jgi:CBS domain-containing protein